MTPCPIARGARLLGIHPKTLHHWLDEAKVPLVPHPTDARIKCVAEDLLREVARQHGRPFPPLIDAPRLSAHEAEPASPAQATSVPSALEAGLIQRLADLETKISTLQEQLAGLALALLQERERTVEQRITALEALIPVLMEKHLPLDLPELGGSQEPAGVSPRVHQLLPVEQRARSRMPALIEYSAPGTYVIVSSQEGEVHLVPDSPEWFEWLASISSFRFVGQQGRFTAYRHDRRSRSWRAYRLIHQQPYKQSLGVTDQLTIHRLEQMAAALQPDMASL